MLGCHTTLRRTFAALSVLALWCGTLGVWTPTAARAQKLRIAVQGATFRPYPIAVPDVQVPTATKAGDAASRTADAVLQRLRLDVDLARHFLLVPPSSYLAPEQDPNQLPRFANWQSAGASGLIRATLQTQGPSQRLALNFYDVAQGKLLVARLCNDAQNSVGRCVHQFLDQVVEKLTGEPGIYSSRIAFVRQVGRKKAIYAVDLDGDNLEKVVDSGPLNLLPAWDLLGRSLMYTSFVTGKSQLVRRSLLNGQTTLLSGQRGLNMGARTSPDGKKVALTLSKDDNTEIYVMDPDGKNLQRLTESWGQDVSPTWSPDGRQLAFVSSRSGSAHIYVMNADGTNQRRLTYRGTYNQEPDWSPRADGRILFTARDEHYVYDLFSVDPRTGDMARLTQDAGNNDGPSHAPDGLHVIFTSSRSPAKGRELYMMDVDGQNQRPLIPGLDGCETPRWGPRLGY